MNKKKGIWLLADLFLFFLLVGIDQFAKYLAVIKLKGKSDYIIWMNVFRLHYLENRGAAFGMLQNQKLFFVFVAVLFVTFVSYALLKMPVEKKFRAGNLLLVMIAAGAVGNMIDRLRYDYVVDFFYFSLINFPVFNVADIYVTVGTALLVILVLFYYKEEDLRFLSLQVSKFDQRD